MSQHLKATVTVDFTGLISLVEQGFYSEFFIVEEGAFVIQSDEFGGFTCKHATVDKCKFSHDEISVGVVNCT